MDLAPHSHKIAEIDFTTMEIDFTVIESTWKMYFI